MNMESEINFREPGFFNFRFKVWVNIRGFLIILNLELFFIFFGFLVVVALRRFGHFEMVTLMMFYSFVCLFCLVTVLWLSPFWAGNTVIEKHFERAESSEIIEVIYNPRRHRGFEAFLKLANDADDVGVFNISDASLNFFGDSSDFVIHKEDIESILFKNIGVKVLWLWGNGIVFKLKEPVANISGFTLYPRIGFTLPQYWRANRKFQKSIKSMGFKIEG